MLTRGFQTSTKGIYAIGGAISPSHILIEQQGVLKEQKHTNLIYTAVKDGVRAVRAIADQA
jgi:thioredoxin reductase